MSLRNTVVGDVVPWTNGVKPNTFTQKPTVILSLSKNLVGWGAMDSGNLGPTSSEESESAPIPIKVADRSLVDLLGKDSSG